MKRCSSKGRVISIAAIVLSILVLPGCKTMELASDWAVEPVTADGEPLEWMPLTSGFVSEDNVQVVARNDADYLHLIVRFRTTDPKWARQSAMAGLTVWLGADGRKSENYGFRYAAGPTHDELPRPTGREGPTGGRGPLSRMTPVLDGQLFYIDLPADSSAVLATDGSAGPSAGFSCEGGMCSYELSFPLRSPADGRYGLGAEPPGAVMVGLTVGPSPEEREAMREAMRGMMDGGGGMRGGGGGGGHGGGMRGPGGQGRGMEENPELWVKVRLAEAGVD